MGPLTSNEDIITLYICPLARDKSIKQSQPDWCRILSALNFIYLLGYRTGLGRYHNRSVHDCILHVYAKKNHPETLYYKLVFLKREIQLWDDV